MTAQLSPKEGIASMKIAKPKIQIERCACSPSISFDTHIIDITLIEPKYSDLPQKQINTSVIFEFREPVSIRLAAFSV